MVARLRDRRNRLHGRLVMECEQIACIQMEGRSEPEGTVGLEVVSLMPSSTLVFCILKILRSCATACASVVLLLIDGSIFTVVGRM